MSRDARIPFWPPSYHLKCIEDLAKVMRLDPRALPTACQIVAIQSRYARLKHLLSAEATAMPILASTPTTKPRHRLTMRDYAATDPRSVAAMLRGCGDGREQRFLDFANKAHQADPAISELELAEFYRLACEHEAWCEAFCEPSLISRIYRLVRRYLVNPAPPPWPPCLRCTRCANRAAHYRGS